MSAQRPLIIAALDNLLAGVDGFSGRVEFPWTDQLNAEDGPFLQVSPGNTTTSDGEVIGQWLHSIPLRIGLVMQGAFDYPAAWEMLAAVAAALSADYSLGGLCQRLTITGMDDSLEVAGNKLFWPHVAITIEYLTPAGAL